MSRCPYAAEVWLGGDRHLFRCERRRAWWPHLHRAGIVGGVQLHAHPGVELRWSSMSTPDYHVNHQRGAAIVVE